MKKEWEKICENYRICLSQRDKLTRSGSEKRKLPTCKFFNKLSFLKVFNSRSRTISNIQLTLHQEDESINDDEEEPNELNEPNCSSREPFSHSRASKKKAKKATDIQMGIDALLVKALCEDKSNTTAKVPQEKKRR